MDGLMVSGGKVDAPLCVLVGHRGGVGECVFLVVFRFCAPSGKLRSTHSSREPRI